MPHGSDEEDDTAPPPPGYSTPTKADRNGGASHAESDAGGMESESDAEGEKQFRVVVLTGKKRKYNVFHKYREVGWWATGEDSELEPKQNLTN